MNKIDRWLLHIVVAVALLAACVQAFAVSAAPAATTTLLVLQDGASLRAAAKEAAPQQATLLRGEVLELRAERLDWWQVWDYRRERGGFVRKSQVLLLAGDAPTLLAQLRLTLPQEGSEGLGLALAAAYIQVATPAELASAQGAEVLDALGQLGVRVAANTGSKRAGLLDVAARFGMRFEAFTHNDGTQRTCYDGDAFRRVLSLPVTPAAQARAALALTRPECRPTTLTPSQLLASDDWRAEVLGHASLEGLPAFEKNRLLLRRASIAASRAFARSDAQLAQAALKDIAQIEPAELAEDDQPEYNDAAMRVNATRWAALPAASERKLGDLQLLLKDGVMPGERCLVVNGAKGAEIFQRCSFARIALASATVNREGTALALAAQPLDGWRELWVVTRGAAGWALQVLPPAGAQPGLGYAEFAGWVPGGQQMLIAQESRAEGRYASRRFAVVDIATLAPQRQSPEAMQLGAFQRWADAGWKGASLALR